MKTIGIQGLIHAIEQGRFAPLLRVAAISVVVLTLALVYLFVKFKGFAEPDAMDQGQIARAIASGEGFSTGYIRPLALWQLGVSGREMPTKQFPDIVHQPLSPTLNAIPLWLTKGSWKIEPLELIYAGERVIAATSILLFLASVVVWYFVGARLFDAKIAFLGITTTLLCDLLWQFSLSGLPHMLMLLLLSLACWFTLRAESAFQNAVPRSFALNLFLAAALLGLLTQCHGLGFWVFSGWLVYCAWRFRFGWTTVAMAAALFLAIQIPWAVRNFQVSGNPFGLAAYTLLWPDDKSDSVMMRTAEPSFRAQVSNLKGKLRHGVIEQMTHAASFLGLNVAAMIFFVSLLHGFKSERASRFRWCVLSMWLFTVIGMVLFGVRGSPVSMNQLHALFIPVMSFFGFAFLLVLWGRLGLNEVFLRRTFIGLILFLGAIPMIFTMFFSSNARIQWPPYVPPFIAVFSEWFDEDEVMCSDMPWAVAWYADRKCLLLPTSPRMLSRISDYRVLGAPISGLYLTPITGNAPLMSSIYKGELKEWAGLIIRPPVTTGFMLPVSLPLPVEGECIIFTDRDRWSQARDR